MEVSYLYFGIKEQEKNKLTIFSENERKVLPKSIFLVFSQSTYKQLTGKDLNLTSNQVGLFTKNKTLKDAKEFVYQMVKTYQIHDSLNDFIKGKVPNIFTIIVSDYSYLVVPDMDDFQESQSKEQQPPKLPMLVLMSKTLHMMPRKIQIC